MLKVIAKLFGGEPEKKDPADKSEMERMTQMRTRITHNKLKALTKPLEEGCESASDQNIITRAKTQEIELGRTNNKTLIASDKGKKPAITMLEGLEERISHLQ